MNFSQEFKSILWQERGFDFDAAALRLFRYQAEHNPVYAAYLHFLRVEVEQINSLSAIPCMPIEFFKEHEVKTGQWEAQEVFLSSGTTQANRSRHLVRDPWFYLENAEQIFKQSYGPLEGYVFLGLLPSYQQQGQSSLVRMVDHFMRRSGQDLPCFFRGPHKDLFQAIAQAKKQNKKAVLFGVTFALLDLAAAISPEEQEIMAGVIVMETGGMKGRRQELVREAVHAALQKGFDLPTIHSEYGMTELLSQAYSAGQGLFRCPSVMRVLLRDPNDPFDVHADRESGGINVIDLANVDTCAFLETKDLGRKLSDGRFEVLGRFDNSDIRGCSLLLA